MTPQNSNMENDETKLERDNLRGILGKTKIPHVTVEWYNEPEEWSPLSITAMNFELLVNSLLSTYMITKNENSISLLAHLSSTLVNICALSSEVTTEGLTPLETLETLKTKLTGDLQHLINDMDIKVPDAFKNAFEGEEN